MVHPSRLAFHGLDMGLATEPGSFTFRIGRSSFDPDMRECVITLDGPVTPYDRRSIVPTATATIPTTVSLTTPEVS